MSPPATSDAATTLESLRQAYRAALSELANPQDEAARLNAAYEAVTAADDAGVLEAAAEGVSLGLFLRLAAMEEADRRWPFAPAGRGIAARGEHRNLIYQLPRVADDAGRRELLDQYRAWGRRVQAKAALKPVRRAPRGRKTRPRIGLMSSDLRIHVVGAFVDPLIDHAPTLDADFYCYSAHPGPADAFQQHVAGHVTAFRHLPGGNARDMAKAVAADSLDGLIEIGGSTNENRLEALAYRPAPVQISWLGYPHSAGLGAIDHIILDPHLAPTEPDLLIEKPLLMPRSWVAMSRGYFRDDLPLAAGLPQDRRGFITFGTAGSPYKYSAPTLAAWGRVVAAVPGSRFLCVRPEGGSPIFRRNMADHFARQGVSADRLEFAAVRGAHLPYYEQIDISLDTFPLTGGMTTCDALWAGVPVVSLAGKAFWERLSHSLLTNAGLADLSTATVEAFVNRAIELAADRPRRLQWRTEARARIMVGPLGDQRRFAEDFFQAVTGVL